MSLSFSRLLNKFQASARQGKKRRKSGLLLNIYNLNWWNISLSAYKEYLP